MTGQDENTILMCTVGGLIGTESKVELQIFSMASTPEHIRASEIEDGIERVQQRYPEAEDVRLREDWHVVEFVPAEDQGEGLPVCTRCPHSSHPGRECGAPMYGMTCYCGRTT